MQSQYLMVAESIIYKNNKLSCINIFDQFLAIKLPAEFNFDLVVICGPGWEPGEYDVSIKAKSTEEDEAEIGSIKVSIPNNNFIYNAIAPGLRITLGEKVTNITFSVYKNAEKVLERIYPVNALFIPSEKEGQQETQSQE